jgi:mannose-6-phosphate isomerase
VQRIRPLEGRIRHYDWGSRTVLARLQGRALPSCPEAELWLGTHAKAPSLIRADADWIPLSDWIARDPSRCLGAEVAARFGAELPFLLKILAVETPLSLQLHPDADRARAGFERERDEGLPRDDPRRSYPDPRPKPELVVALTRFEALVGFRPPSEIAERIGPLGLEAVLPELGSAWGEASPAALRQLLSGLLGLDPASLESALARLGESDPNDAALAWIPRLAAAHPDDAAALAPLFLQHVVLEPGEALFLPPGRLHCYLGGVAVEIMASSDNVIRAGLTHKPKNLLELVRIASFESGPVDRLQPPPTSSAEFLYPCTAAEFALSALHPGLGALILEPTSAEVVLCVEGEVRLSDTAGGVEVLRAGSAAFVPAAVSAYHVEGRGLAYRARSPRASTEEP